MAFDTSKTLLLEKRYLYVRASKGFVLEGVSTERIWTNVGYYRFLTENVSEALGNSYVKINYDSSDSDFVAYCSDLFLEEIQNSVTVAVENIEQVINNMNDNLGLSLGLISSEINPLASDTLSINGVQTSVDEDTVTSFNGAIGELRYLIVYNSNQDYDTAIVLGLGMSKTFRITCLASDSIGVDYSSKIVGGDGVNSFNYNLKYDVAKKGITVLEIMRVL